MSFRLQVFTLLAIALLPLRASSLPDEVKTALDAYRTEGPKGWAFVQSTVGEDKQLVESYDPLQPDHQKWTLVSKDNRPPTSSEINSYRQQQTRRTGGETAPNVKNQLDHDSFELASDDGTRAQWRFRLVPGAHDDTSAEHMAATFTFHRPTQTIERVELASFESFSPVFAVNIDEARTVLEYSLPSDNRPSLLQRITVRVRGRAFLFKSLDSDMTVSYSEYTFAGKS